MCCVKVYYLSWTFLSLKLKKNEKGDVVVVGGGEERERARGGGERKHTEVHAIN